MPQKVAFDIKVTSDDPKNKKKPEDTPDDKDKAKDVKEEGSSKLKDDEKDADEMSEEDIQLKNELEMLVERLKEPDTNLHRPALETMRTLIRSATSSMTSVPKPLKFLRPQYPDLQALCEAWPPTEDKSVFADILSVLAMTYSDTQPRGTLRYRLLSASLLPAASPLSEPGTWGHEYVRHLAAELGEEYSSRQEEDLTTPAEKKKAERKKELEEKAEKAAEAKGEAIKPVIKIVIDASHEELQALGMQCGKFLLEHNAEPDAVDLMTELEIVARLTELVDDNTYPRVCQYMVRCVGLLPPPEDIAFLRAAHAIYVKYSKFPEALALSIRLNEPELIRADFNAPGNPLMKRQLAFLLARAQVPIEWLQPPIDEDGDADDDAEFAEELPEDLMECLSNAKLSHHFREFGKEVGVADAKSLEDVYKSHLENTRSGTSANVDSARGNLAGTFVNAFVNAGFGNDKLMVEAEEGNSWIYKNKDHGMMSAAASLGVSLLWDTDVGLSHVDKYTYSSEEHIKAGALLATGLLNTGVRTEADAALALLGDYVENKSVPLKTSAIMGLGLAYTGSHREDLLALLLPSVADEGVSMEVAGLSSLALGFVFVGSGNGDVAGTILQVLMEREDKHLDEKWSRFMVLGLALLYLGMQDGSEATLETLKAIEHPVSKQAQILVEACAYAGTGNVLRIQTMLHHCDEHLDKDKEKAETTAEDAPAAGEKEEQPKADNTFQGFAVIAIALIAMGEDIGAEMSLRQFNHLMHFGDATIRKTVPLALGLVSVSNPVLPILDTLSKYSHDNDLAVALNAIFAMGLVGAGTNNARLAQMLRQLAGYYHKEADCLFMVRIAQGLVHLGKGTIGLSPFFSDRSIMSRPAVAGLLATLTAFTDAKAFVLDKYHWMLYFLVPSMYPRFLITLDEKLDSVPVTVRVGQAVDVVGQAGKPRTISGFQTHQTPVRLGTTERAELATEEFIPFAHVLEGFVVLQKNPGWEKEDKMQV